MANTLTRPPPPSSLVIISNQVRREISKLRINKATGPDNINPRVLRSCAEQLAEVFQHLFNLSLRLKKVPQLWKTCILPVTKKRCPSTLNDYRPVALTSHAIKTFYRLVLKHLKPHTSDSLDPIQLAYQTHISIDDVIIYLLHRAYSHLEKL